MYKPILSIQTYIEWKKKECVYKYGEMLINETRLMSTQMLTVLLHLFCGFVIFQNKKLEKIRINIKDSLAHFQMYYLS